MTLIIGIYKQIYIDYVYIYHYKLLLKTEKVETYILVHINTVSQHLYPKIKLLYYTFRTVIYIKQITN